MWQEEKEVGRRREGGRQEEKEVGRREGGEETSFFLPRHYEVTAIEKLAAQLCLAKERASVTNNYLYLPPRD